MYYKLSGNKVKQFQVLFCLQMQSKCRSEIPILSVLVDSKLPMCNIELFGLNIFYCTWFEKSLFEKDTIITQWLIILSL